MTIKEMYAKYRPFASFVLPYKWRALAGILMHIPAAGMDGLIAALMRPFTDEVLLARTADVKYIPIFIIVFTVVQSCFKYAGSYLLTWSSMRIANDVKKALFQKLLHCDPEVFDKSTSGEVLIRYNGDADTASNGLLGNINTFITRIFTSLFLIAILFYQSWQLAIVAVTALLLAVTPMTRVRKRIKQIIRESLDAGAAVTTNYNEAFNGNRTITSYNLYEQQTARLDATLRRIFHLSIKMVQRTGFMSMGMHFAISLGIASVIWLQSYMVVESLISFGNLVSFMIALLMLYTPVKNIGNNFTKIQTSLAAVDRVMEILGREPKIGNRPEAARFSRLGSGIRYDNVIFSYIPGKEVLKGVTLDIPAGQSVAFVGNSGGGKTTLVNLLPRFYDTDSGTISIDGTDIRDMDLRSLRDAIAIVFQDNFLFGGTIRDNIMLGKKDATDEELAQAIKAACLDEFVAGLELGLDTQIGERGIMLSGGQKQRVAIARAFIKDAPIVILDEATSALDNKSEAVVQRAIENLMRNKTVLIIAHRLTTIINSDRIVVIRDGTLAESGTHAELMAMENGVYASLYRTQQWQS